MEALRETTDWAAPNHTYLLNGTKCLAFIPYGSDQPQYFTNPLSFHKRGRTFARASVKLFKAKPNPRLVRIAGSRGAVYWLDPDAGTCTCPGYTYRGACKHIAGSGLR